MGDKSDLELSDERLSERGLSSGADQIKSIREEWADRCNSSLERAQVLDRVDHRSHAERGIEAEPGRHLGPAGTALQRELAAVRQALGEAREALKGFAGEIATTARSAVRGIIERFREAGPGVSSGEPSEGGILAGLREERQARGSTRDIPPQHSHQCTRTTKAKNYAMPTDPQAELSQILMSTRLGIIALIPVLVIFYASEQAKSRGISIRNCAWAIAKSVILYIAGLELIVAIRTCATESSTKQCGVSRTVLCGATARCIGRSRRSRFPVVRVLVFPGNGGC